MALKGSLKDFSLPDLFQLLNFSKKNGTLNLLRGNARGYVCFRNGEVFFATTNWKRKPLGVKLLQAGIVTKAQVDESLELQRTTARGQRLGQLLIRLGYLTKDKLEVFVQEQIQDAVFELLRWTEGEFEFQPGVVFPEEDIGLSISTEELIMEGSRRLDEWNRIEKKIPDLDVIFKMKSMQERVAAQISLTPEEWMVLTFIDGERTVKDIVDLTAMGTLQTCKIVYGLIASGLLENVSPDVSDVKVEQELERMAEELMQLDEMVIERPGFVAREELAPVEEAEEASVLPVVPLAETAPLEEEVSLGEEVTLAEEAPLIEEVPAATEIAAPVVEEVAQAETIGRDREKEEEASESLEVEIEEDMEGEILIEEIFSDDETIGIEEAEEVEEIEELGVEIAEDLLAEEEAVELPVAEAAPVEETPFAAELEDLVAEAAEQVVEIEMEVPGTIAEAEEPPSRPAFEPLVLDAVEELEAEMLAGVLEEEEVVTFEAAEEPAVEVPLEGVVEPPGAGEEVRRELEAEAASMVSEMRDFTLEESQDATSELELGEKEEELAMLKEKIISLLPEGMGLAEEEKVESPEEEPLFEGKEPPSYRHKTMTDESIEAQAAKSAYLEKRYGKVGKLADQGDLAGMEPDEIPLEWSGHLERTSNRQEVSTMPGGLKEEDEQSEKAEVAGRAIDPTKILGAAFRVGELKEEESESLGLEERIVDLTRPPTGTLSIEDLVEGVRQETGADMTEAIRSRIEEMEASVAMAERMAPEQVEGRSEEVDTHDRAGVVEELEEARRAVGFTPPRNSVELLEEEMLEDYTAEGQMLEEAAPPEMVAEEVVAAGEEAATAETGMPPAMDDTFLRIEELELDMLEGVIEEDLVGMEPALMDMATMPLEEVSQLEEAAAPVEEAMIPVEVSAATGPAQAHPMNVSELEDDMLVDYIAGEGGAAVPAAREEEQSLVSEEMEGLEDDLAALEKELFAEEEVALEEDILTDIEEIEKSITQEEPVEPEAPVEAAAPPAALFEPPPVEIAAPPASEPDMLERIIEAPEQPPAEPVVPPAAFIAPEPPVPAAVPPASELDMLERIIEAPEQPPAESVVPPAAFIAPEPPASPAVPPTSELDMLERIIEAPEQPPAESVVPPAAFIAPEPPASPAVPPTSELDMLERIIEMPEVVEEVPASPAVPPASELDMLERIIEMPEVVEEVPASPAVPPASELDMLERIIEMPEVVEEVPASPASELDMLERIIEAPEQPPAEPVVPPAAFIAPEPPLPAAAPPPAEPVVPPAAFIAPEPPLPAAAPPPAPDVAKTFEVIEEPLPKILEEPEMGVAAPPVAQAAPPPEAKAYPAPQETFDTGSYTLERELAELTGAGAPQPTRKIKIPVKPGKEGESSMQEMAKGKPVPKVKRDKTVTKGIIVRIIDGIKKL